MLRNYELTRSNFSYHIVVHSKEGKYDPGQYSAITIPSTKLLRSLLASKSKERTEAPQRLSEEKLAPERQTKSSQSHLKFKLKEQQQNETLSEGFRNKTIRESSELHMTVNFKDGK